MDPLLPVTLHETAGRADVCTASSDCLCRGVGVVRCSPQKLDTFSVARCNTEPSLQGRSYRDPVSRSAVSSSRGGAAACSITLREQQWFTASHTTAKHFLQQFSFGHARSMMVLELVELQSGTSRHCIQPAEYCGCHLRYDGPRVLSIVLNTFWSMLWNCDVRLWMLQEIYRGNVAGMRYCSAHQTR
jgi:hypothetical protein